MNIRLTVVIIAVLACTSNQQAMRSNQVDLCGPCSIAPAVSVENLIVQESIRNGIDPFLPLAIAWRESRYLPHVVHRNKGGQRDWGVFQISDHGLRALHLDTPLDARLNIVAGVGLIAQYIRVCGSEAGAAHAFAYGRCR